MKKPRKRRRLDPLTKTVVALSIVTIYGLLAIAAFVVMAAMSLPPTDAPRASVKARVLVVRRAPTPPPAPKAVAAAPPPAAPVATESPLQAWLRVVPSPIDTSAPPEPVGRKAYLAMIRDAAERNALPASLVEAVVTVESDFNPTELSSKGARGVMQVIPETGRRFGVRNPDHLYQPRTNIAAGTAYLAWLLDRYHGNVDLALAAYNAGEGAVDGYRGIPPYPETQEYVRRVHAALEHIVERQTARREG